jgi:hypothetical protein
MVLLGERLKWKLALVRLEIVLILMQDLHGLRRTHHWLVNRFGRADDSTR